MRIKQHPEYALYKRHQERVATCHAVVDAWQVSAEPIQAMDSTTWTVGRAREFVHSLAKFFRAYNCVLWEEFAYCRQCRGGCCVVGASEVTLFDGLALALAGGSFPERPERLETTARACIYLTTEGCSWPAGWRPLKCWTFYCLGSGNWELDAADERYRALTAALQPVLDDYLPQPLQGAHEQLRPKLADPISFSRTLNQLLDDYFVAPIAERFPQLKRVDPRSEQRNGKLDQASYDDALAFISRAVETIWASTVELIEAPISSEQLLADLEELEWILFGEPRHRQKLLEQLYCRYAELPALADDETMGLHYELREHLVRLLSELSDDTDWHSGSNLIRIDDIGPPIV